MKKIFLILVLCLSCLFFTIPAMAVDFDLTLQWDENTEPDLATGENPRYKIYYKTTPENHGDKASYIGFPKLEHAADEGESPVSVTVSQDENPDAGIVQFTLHNLDDTVYYYIAVTALDEWGNESDLSDRVSTDKQPPAPPKNLIMEIIEKVVGFFKSIFRNLLV